MLGRNAIRGAEHGERGEIVLPVQKRHQYWWPVAEMGMGGKGIHTWFTSFS